MDFKNYLGYKVYENGSVVNKNNVTLKPQRGAKNYLFYYLSISGKTKKVSAGSVVLFAFEIYPKVFNQKVKHIDGNYQNNSLNNLKW